jgi:hypothetical protein
MIGQSVGLVPATRQNLIYRLATKRAIESDLTGFDGRLSMALRWFIALPLELSGLSSVVSS